uniref:Uncharacterized protein n=1 Tax=Nelumbo nucifera TaxID=4432 RepID=A0A822ZJD6_NELNU|nr:TPA_asm: hypothetical protein HUJ06_002993 [Nelumbo nucifera]
MNRRSGLAQKESTFHGIRASPLKTIARSDAYNALLAELLHTNVDPMGPPTLSSSSTNQTVWCPPPAGWWKVNVDASVATIYLRGSVWWVEIMLGTYFAAYP